METLARRLARRRRVGVSQRGARAALASAMLACVAAWPAAAGDAEAALASGLAARLHAEVVAARTAAGLAPLAWDEALATIAATHSADMARRGYFGHTSPEGRGFQARYAAAGYACRVQVGTRIHLGAENLAQRERRVAGRVPDDARSWPDTAQLARAIVAGWMASPGHRQNLLAPHWRRVGIGVHATASRILVTQDFC